MCVSNFPSMTMSRCMLPVGDGGQCCGLDAVNVSSVKSELRYPIIQVIRSQWESQDLPTF